MCNKLMLVERKRDDDWQRIDFVDLRAGDTFRLRDPDTKKLSTGRISKGSIYVAATDPYIDSDSGMYSVNVRMEDICMTCNDCKYFELADYKNSGYCSLWDRYVKDDDSCDDGEEI